MLVFILLYASKRAYGRVSVKTIPENDTRTFVEKVTLSQGNPQGLRCVSLQMLGHPRIKTYPQGRTQRGDEVSEHFSAEVYSLVFHST